MTACTLKPSARVEQGERLCQAVGVEASFNTFLTSKEWVVTIHALDLLSRSPLVNLTHEKTLRLRYTCTISGTYAKGCLMDAMTYSTARANLAGVMNRVCEDHEPLIITRNGDQSVVMLSLDDYKALEETAYLLRTPANARRLLTSIAQLNAGQAVERELIK